MTKKADAKTEKPAEPKLNDLLSSLDDAASVYQEKSELLAQARSEQVTSLQAAQAAFDKVKADHDAKVAAAVTAADEARRVLDGLKDQVNAKIGLLTGGSDPRVSVK